MADIHHRDAPAGFGYSGYLPGTDESEEAGNPLLGVLAVGVLFVAAFAVAWTYGVVGVVGALQSFGPELAAAPRLMQ